jgi:hypothetical protein
MNVVPVHELHATETSIKLKVKLNVEKVRLVNYYLYTQYVNKYKRSQ